MQNDSSERNEMPEMLEKGKAVIFCVPKGSISHLQRFLLHFRGKIKSEFKRKDYLELF